MNHETQALLDSLKTTLDDPTWINDKIRESGLTLLDSAGVPVDMLPVRVGELYFRLVIAMYYGDVLATAFGLETKPHDLIPLVRALFCGMYFASKEYEGR